MTHPSSEYYIGLMSGTSVDGVDAALVEFCQDEFSVIGYLTEPMPYPLQQTLLQLNQHPTIDLEKLCQLQKDVADLFSNAVKNLLKQTQLSAKHIRAIGSHGQTIFHSPHIGMTLQIGHPALIAKQTGITTVADFRVDDMALGGQGAPFAPAFHQQAFNQEIPCFVVNIGGIANVSYLPQSKSDKVIGFDTGPGNALIDEACQMHFNVKYDHNGDLAKKGYVHTALLHSLLQHPYFKAPAPKSTGRESFNIDWVTKQLTTLEIEISKQDLLTTLTELTAISIAQSIQSLATTNESVWIVGGGAFNTFLLERIQTHLNKHNVASSQQVGIDPNAVEACLCAWLAKERLANKTINLAQTTGASRNAVLGGIWHS